MNDQQRAALALLCERYNVPFDETKFVVHPPTSCMMPGWAEGWVGPIFVGCSPEGSIHS